jgi:hypothetical protein
MREKEETKGQQIRFPVEIYHKLQKRAKESHRSINAEVVRSLELFLEAVEAMEAHTGKKAK